MICVASTYNFSQEFLQLDTVLVSSAIHVHEPRTVTNKPRNLEWDKVSKVEVIFFLLDPEFVQVNARERDKAVFTRRVLMFVMIENLNDCRCRKPRNMNLKDPKLRPVNFPS